jgi:membrane-associated HD superfamily phosphohydrolase
MTIGDGRRVTDRVVPILDPPPRGIAYHAKRALIVVGLAIATYVLFPASPAVDVPIFEVGAVANQEVIAPFAFTVRKSDADLAREREELSRSAKPIFTYSSAARDSALRTLDEFMTAVGRAASGAGSPREAVPAVQRAASEFNITLLPGEAEYLADATRRGTMREGLRRVYSRWLSAGVTSSSALDEFRGEVILRRGGEERNMLADSLLTFGGLLSRARLVHPAPDSSVGDALYIKLLGAFFRPTVTYDRVATERRRQELRNAVDVTRYTVRAGERIIGEHEVVGREEHEKLRALHDAIQTRTGGERSASRVAGTVLYNALVLLIFWATIGLFRPALYDSMRWLATFAALFLLVLGGAAIVAHITPVRPELVPIALAAIILSILFDPRISMIAAMILAVLIGGQSVFRGTNALFINLIVGAAAAISVRVIRRRDQAYYSILAIGAAYLLAALAIGLTLDWSPRVIGMSALWGSVNAVVSVSLAMVLLPLAEKLTFITTDLTLLEYSDLNRKLLRRLMLEAPGTQRCLLLM